MDTRISAESKIIPFHIIRLDRGEKIMERLLEYIRKTGIKSGFLTGIGATSMAEIGWFDPVKQIYEKKVVHEPCEITTMIGNRAWFGDEPVAHTHITLGKPDFSVVGGHLMEAVVGVTCEIWITESSLAVRRSITEIGNLKLIDFNA
jgi:predicted DNA-binding protein with PD1-like motif